MLPLPDVDGMELHRAGVVEVPAVARLQDGSHAVAYFRVTEVTPIA
jgi:hypothetical protein